MASIQNRSNLWVCPICPTKPSMSRSNRPAHLAGAKHHKAQASSTRRLLCEACDIVMAVGDWSSHVSGQKHAKALRASQTSNTETSTSDNPLSLPSSHTSTQTILAHVTPAAQGPSAKKPRFSCIVCDRVMREDDKVAHLAGSGHREAIRRASRIGKAKAAPTSHPKAAPTPHPKAAPTSHPYREEHDSDPDSESEAEDACSEFDDEDACSEFDDEDARWLLYDIDTQWGSMPQGGAYTESNHYYGPGPDYAY